MNLDGNLDGGRFLGRNRINVSADTVRLVLDDFLDYMYLTFEPDLGDHLISSTLSTVQANC